MSRIRNLCERGREEGQALVEFALSILLVFFIVLCCWELLMGIYTASVLADAAKEGVRYAIVHGSYSSLCSGPNSGTPCAYDPSAANVTARVRDYCSASLHDISAIDISVTYTDGNNTPPSRVSVTVTYVYKPFANILFFQPVLRTHATGRIVS
jgi:hypothetical protein